MSISLRDLAINCSLYWSLFVSALSCSATRENGFQFCVRCFLNQLTFLTNLKSGQYLSTRFKWEGAWCVQQLVNDRFLIKSLQSPAHRTTVGSVSFYGYFLASVLQDSRLVLPFPVTSSRSSGVRAVCHLYPLLIPRCRNFLISISFILRAAKLWNNFALFTFPRTRNYFCFWKQSQQTEPYSDVPRRHQPLALSFDQGIFSFCRKSLRIFEKPTWTNVLIVIVQHCIFIREICSR